MDIVKFEWDTGLHEDYNGKSLIIGVPLPNSISEEELERFVPVYGFSIDIKDESKDFRLKRLSCSRKYVTSEIAKITKEEARKLCIKYIDEQLNILYSKEENILAKEYLDKKSEEENEGEND